MHYGLAPSTEVGGEWDAFRHAYASGAMTREYGETPAHVFGDLNEIYGDVVRSQQENDRNMDKWNNAVGRDIGKNTTSSDEIARWVYEAMQRGDLITHQDDTRRYDGSNPPGERNNSGINGGTGGSGDTGGEDAITEETAPSGQDALVPDLESDLHTDQLSNFPAQNLIPADNTSCAVIQEIPEPKVRQRSYYDYEEMQEMQQSDAHNPASTPVHINEGESDSISLVAGEKQQTAVDPLVMDMRGDALLFYSGQLRHGGWVDAGNGSLVWCYNNGSIIDDNSTAFSPRIHANYYNEFWPDADNGNHNEIIDILDAAWNLLKVWAGISDDAQGWMGGDNNVHLDSGKHSELNSPGQAGISQLQSTTRGTVQNEPCGDNRLLQPDTVMQHGEVEISYSIGFMHDKLNYTMTAPNSGALWRLWFHPGAVNTATTWLSQRYGGAVNEPATLLDTQTIYQRFHATRKPAELAYPDTITTAQVEVIPQPLLTAPPLMAQGQSADKQASHSAGDTLRDTPMSSLMDSLVAFTPPPADGQMRFSSDYHTAMTPLMAAGWQ